MTDIDEATLETESADIAIWAIKTMKDTVVLADCPYTHEQLDNALTHIEAVRESLDSDEPFTFDEIIDQCIEDSIEWFPEHADDIPFLTLALCGETGELANLVKKVERGSHSFKDLFPKMYEETTDIFIYLMNIVACWRENAAAPYDLLEAYKAKRAENMKRFGKCICGTPGTGNFEGPQRDCPKHGQEVFSDNA